MTYASAVASSTDVSFSYIPLHAGRKNAKGSWKQYQTERADPESVQSWQDGGHNLGIVTGPISGIVVIDLDNESAIELARQKGLPPTPVVRTPRGEHHYYRWPEAGLRNKAAIFDGIDLRAEAGYVVAAGSSFEPNEKELADGKVAGKYEWIEGTEQLPFADLPQWFLDACEADKPAKSGRSAPSSPANQNRPSEYGRRALDSEIAVLKSAGEGNRNHQLNTSAFALGQLIASGDLDERATGFALMAAALAIGLDEEESQKTIESGFAAGMASPRKEKSETILSSGLDFNRLAKNIEARQDIDEQPIVATTIETELAKLDPDDMSSLSEVSAQLAYAASFGDFSHPEAIKALTKQAHELWDDSSKIVECMTYGNKLVRDYDAGFEITKSENSDTEARVHKRPLDQNGKPLPRLKTIKLRDIKPILDGNWLIKNIMPARGTSCTYGHSGTYKSFFMLDMGLHVAHGWDWLD